MAQKDETSILIDGLSNTPQILSQFLEHIPIDRLKTRRRPGKWSIHENACHIAQAEKMIHNRFESFRDEPRPIFEPYLPGRVNPDSDLLNMDLTMQMKQFTKLRGQTIILLKSFDDSIWVKSADHPQYDEYNTLILLRHTLLHDHFHMYRIEELWLTKTELL